RWPMIVLRTPKGWTCPKEIDGKKCEGAGARTGADGGHGQPRARPHPRGLDEELPAGGALRRVGAAYPGARRAAADRAPADEPQSARQRRAPAEGPEATRLPIVAVDVPQPGGATAEPRSCRVRSCAT